MLLRFLESSSLVSVLTSDLLLQSCGGQSRSSVVVPCFSSCSSENMSKPLVFRRFCGALEVFSHDPRPLSPKAPRLPPFPNRISHSGSH